MTFHVVIPARYASERLPGKPLADVGGEAMIVRVARAAAASAAASVVVATDDERVRAVTTAAGVDTAMTRTDHPSGSDRVMEVAESRGWQDDELVINVQGDEPLIPPEVIDQLADGLASQPTFSVGTLCEPITREDDFADPNIVKVVRSASGRALYFSRAAIPHARDGTASAMWRHVGIYGYRIAALRRFVDQPPAELELTERLEQLRLLDDDVDMLVLEACRPVPGGVDTDEDLARVNALFD